jgi:hypothetical protein
MRRRRVAGAVVAVGAAVAAALGPVQAASAAPLGVSAHVAAGSVAVAHGRASAMSPASAQSINCGTPSLGFDGNQWYYSVACTGTGTTQWWANISCTDGLTHSAGPYTGFLNVRVYCPVGTTAIQGWVSYTP